MSTATARRVRVTVEGDVVSQHGNALRVCYGVDGLAIIDTGAEGVSVEDVTPARQWQDGDATVCMALLWVRAGGTWIMPELPDSLPCSDDEVTAAVEAGSSIVVRYQAGGDA